MPHVIPTPTTSELDQMHALYREGGDRRATAPHVVYHHPPCPHAGCRQSFHAIDFRLETFGPAIHDPLVRAWWNDTGFAGRCPSCGRWIHFTIRAKRPIDETQAQSLPQLPPNWADEATIL